MGSIVTVRYKPPTRKTDAWGTLSAKPRPFQKPGRIGQPERPNRFLGVSSKSAKGLPRFYLIKSSKFSAMSGADWSQ